jgi:UDP-glucose:(heptosyl)LPS alpha-1,3-glucosyltransferase
MIDAANGGSSPKRTWHMDIGLVKRAFRLQGGGERQIAYLIDGLQAQGFGVQLFCEDPPSTPRRDGLTCRIVPHFYGPRSMRALGFALSVRTALRGAALPLVQSFDRTLGQHIYRAGEGVHREWLGRKRQALPALARGWSCVNLFDRVMVALERRVFCQTPVIIANSQRGRAEIRRHYGISDTRLRTIYNGVDPVRFHPGVRSRWRDGQRAAWGVCPDEIVLLYVGSGFQRKGLGYLIQALARVRARGGTNLRLVIVGKGSITPYLRLARQHSLCDCVRFEGHRADVERCYAGADLFVLPTLYDPFANTCLEAMACGLPTVTTQANGAAELIQDGVNGCIVANALDVERLAQVVQSLLPQEQRHVMGEAAAKTACEYPLSRALDQTLRLYDSVLSHAV